MSTVPVRARPWQPDMPDSDVSNRVGRAIMSDNAGQLGGLLAGAFGVDVNGRLRGIPLLHLTAMNLSLRCALRLLERGASVHRTARAYSGFGYQAIPVKEGDSVLHLTLRAVTGSHDEIPESDVRKAMTLLEMFLLYGANPNHANIDMETPLFHALAAGRSFTRLILRAGGDPNARARDGDTALFRSICVADNSTIVLLLKSGADATARDAQGESSLERAIRMPCILKALLNHGAPQLTGAEGKRVWQKYVRNNFHPPLRRQLRKVRLAFTPDCFE